MKASTSILAGLALLAQCIATPALASGNVRGIAGILVKIRPGLVSLNDGLAVKPLTRLGDLPGLSKIKLPVLGNLAALGGTEATIFIIGPDLFEAALAASQK